MEPFKPEPLVEAVTALVLHPECSTAAAVPSQFIRSLVRTNKCTHKSKMDPFNGNSFRSGLVCLFYWQISWEAEKHSPGSLAL